MCPFCVSNLGEHSHVSEMVCLNVSSGMLCTWLFFWCCFVIFIVLYLLVVNVFNLVCSVDEYLKLVAESIHVRI